VFKNRVLRRIFGPKKDEVMGEWRKLNNGKLCNLYSSPDIIRQIKSRRIRWVGYVHAWERRKKCTRFWWESLNERGHLKYRGIDGRMGLEWILGRLGGGCGVDSSGSGYGPVAGSCECSNEPSGSGTMELVNS
jgi:hypothetical protein